MIVQDLCRRSAWSGLFLVALSFGLLGCEAPSSPVTPATPTANVPPAALPPAASSAPAPAVAAAADSPTETGTKSGIQLDVASWEETQQLIAKHQGKVVVLDLWSTYCEPCVKEFPHLVSLQHAHPDDVVCISLNCNYIGTGKPEEEKPAVLEFLTKKQAEIINLISRDTDEDLYKKLGIASIPVVQVYGRDGKLAKQFDNEKEEYGKEGFNYEQHITPYVAELVKNK